MKNSITLIILSLATVTMRAQPYPAFRMFDLNTGLGYSNPNTFYLIGSKLIFRATDSTHGSELWISDGTATSTMPIADITPGLSSTAVLTIAATDSQLFFTSFDSSNGWEPWVTDGTSSGTRMVKDINQGPAHSAPGPKIAYNNMVIFAAADSAAGRELWISDGSPMGTQLLKDIYPGKTNDGNPADFIIFKNKVWFTATSASGYCLWTTDGTTGNTQPVTGILSGPDANSIFATASHLYFAQLSTNSPGALWITDGTSQGTQLLVDPYPGSNNGLGGAECIEHNGKVYLIAYDRQANGISKLYLTDGTPTGTTLLKTFPGDASLLCSYKNRLFFNATDSGQDNELWVTDGTVSGTKMVKDIRSGSAGSDPKNLTVYNDYLYFSAETTLGNRVLMRTDGSDTGTVEISATSYLNPLGPNSEFIVFDSALFFRAAYSSLSIELWSMRDSIAMPDNIIDTSKDQYFSIYPNPAHGSFTISSTLPSGSTATVELLNIYGQLVLTERLTERKQRINLHNIPPGMYLVTLREFGQGKTVQLTVN